jgi:hypothetical protein
MKVKVVKFDDGRYGVRRGTWFTGYRYKDLASCRNDFWWGIRSPHFHDTKTKSYETAYKASIATVDKGTVVLSPPITEEYTKLSKDLMKTIEDTVKICVKQELHKQYMTQQKGMTEREVY